MPPAPSDRPKLGSRHRLLLRVERFSRKNYRLVFLLALLAVVAGTWLGAKLDLESNILDLIPAGNRQVDTLKEALEDFGSIDYLLILLEAGEEDDADALEDFADRFADRLGGLAGLVEYVDYRFELEDDFLELLYENAILFLPPDRLGELEARLTDEAIDRRLQEIRLGQNTPIALVMADLATADPLQLMPLFLDRLLSGNQGALKIDISDGYYLARDSSALIMLVKPTGPSQDVEFDKRLIASVEQVEQQVRDELAEEGDTAAGIGVRYSGNYAMVVDESALIQVDVARNLLVSLFAVSALYFLCYRRFAALLYSSVPLLIGQALTFGLAFLVLQWGLSRGLNAASSAFTALLMGLGTDFVIVIYARYVEERHAGKSLAQATELMIGETGLGVFTGAITSAGTFLALCTSQFRGLWDLGFLIGFGILLCAVAILFLVPAMITWNEGVRKRKVDAVKKLHLQSFLLEYLIPFSARHRTLVIVGVLAVTAGAGYLALRLDFDDTIGALRSERSAAFKTQQEIGRKFGASLSYMMAIAEAPTEREAIELTEKIEERVQPYLADGTIGSFDSVLTYLPPDAQQQRILAAVAADTRGAFDPQRIRTAFLAAQDRNGFRENAFTEFLDRLDGLLAPRQQIGLQDLQRRGMDRLLNRYVAVDPGRVRIVTYMFLAERKWKREPPPGLVEALTGDAPGIVVTGTNVVNTEFRMIFMREAPRAVLIGLVVVFVLLWVDFRSLKLTGIALTQLICGVIMMLGAMRVAGLELNYVNAFVATMILGVGIDYSIHLVHRLSLSRGKIEPGLLETGKAVVIAALTNIAGFGTLALGNYPALRSFGLVALLGSVTCLFTALTLVPAIMVRRAERGG